MESGRAEMEDFESWILDGIGYLKTILPGDERTLHKTRD